MVGFTDLPLALNVKELIVNDELEGVARGPRRIPAGDAASYIGAGRQIGLDFRDYPGVNGNDHDDTDSFADFLADFTDSLTNRQVRGTAIIPAGRYNSTLPLVLPSFTAGVDEEGPPVHLHGSGAAHTIITVDGDGDYALSHSTIGGTEANRDRNYDHRIGGFTLIGPSDLANPMSGIGVDNIHLGKLYDLRLSGFPGGDGIEIYTHRGGAFGLELEDIEIGDNNRPTDATLSELSFMAQRVRNGIRLNGPIDTTGKANDIRIKRVRIMNALIGCISTEGHGDWAGGASFGPLANLETNGCLWFCEEARKIESGTIFALTSGTVFKLKQSSFHFGANDDLNGWGVAVTSAATGRTHYAYIIDFTGSTRQVTTGNLIQKVGGSAYTPTTSDTYRIFYCDALSRALFPNFAGAHQYGLYWTTRNGSFTGYLNDYLEECRPIVAGAYGNTHVVFNTARQLIGTGQECIREDGTRWAPDTFYGPKVSGSQEAPQYAGLPSLNLGLTDFPGSPAPLTTYKINDTGRNVRSGEVIRFSTADKTLAKAPVAYTAGDGGNQHAVAWSPQVVEWENGELMTIVMVGPCQALVNGDGTVGDILVSAGTDGTLNVIPDATVLANTAEAGVRALARKVGRLAASKSDGITSLAQIWIGN